MRLVVSVTVGILLFAGCGEFERQYPCVMEGRDCAKTNSESEDGEDNSGQRGPAGKQGRDGEKGDQGFDGTPGVDGTSCSIEQVANGAVVTCPDGAGVLILNGTNGTNGIDATPSSFTFTEIITPCNQSVPTATAYEILFRTYSGQLVAHYSQGSKQFLTLLGPGNYQLTDFSNCTFTVLPNLDVVDMYGNIWVNP